MKHILLVLTSHDQLGKTGRKTGFYVPEAAHPYAAFSAAGYEVEFVSPQGGQPPLDGIDREDPVQRAFLEDETVMQKLAHTRTPAEIDPANYDAILYVGGHGTMWDFAPNQQLATIAGAVYDQGGVVAAVCHRPAGLVNIKRADGRYLVDGQPVTGFTNAEEQAVGLTEVVPFLLETALRERGAQFSGAANFQANVVVGERLVTGQNPASAQGVAEAIVTLLGR